MVRSSLVIFSAPFISHFLLYLQNNDGYMGIYDQVIWKADSPCSFIPFSFYLILYLRVSFIYRRKVTNSVYIIEHELLMNDQLMFSYLNRAHEAIEIKSGRVCCSDIILDSRTRSLAFDSYYSNSPESICYSHIPSSPTSLLGNQFIYQTWPIGGCHVERPTFP